MRRRGRAPEVDDETVVEVRRRADDERENVRPRDRAASEIPERTPL
jgi:hypothetical protein